MSRRYQDADPFASAAFQGMKDFINEQMESPVEADHAGFEQFERDLHRRIQAFEAQVVRKRLQQYDLDVEEIEVYGERFRRKDQFEKEYHGLAGSFVVRRTLYVPRGGHGRAVVPLEFRAGMIDGTWTPLLARVMARTVASTIPREAAELFEEFGGARPSPSSLDRLPKKLSEVWESQRELFEAEIRSRETIPENAVAIGGSLDGVMVPMKGEPPLDAPDDNQPAEGEKDRQPKRPTEYREAGCGTVSYYDTEGNRLQTVYQGSAPEAKKATLKSQLREELQSIFALRPELKLVTVADGAQDNWDFLSTLAKDLHIEESWEVTDFFHVMERVKEALDAYHGKDTTAARAAFEECRLWLRQEEDGPERVLRALRYRRDKSQGQKKKTITEQIKYVENRKKEGRLCYKTLLDANLPIGSGVVEAACKTLVTQRLKCSGMSWGFEGVQGILTLRSLVQSNRWDLGWNILAEQYRTEVKIVPFKAPKKLAS